MAYPITQEALDLFIEPYRQVTEITFNGTNDNLLLTEQNIPLGGLSINRYSISGNKIEIGSVVAAELSLALDNSNGKFDDVLFEGAELFVRVGVKKWDAKRWENAVIHYVPMGYFTVDEAPRKLEKITLTALDRMVHFDKPVDLTKLSFPMTIGALLARICEICNVTLGIIPEELINHNYMVNEAPTDDDLTYRQILSWIAEITGTCGFIDWNGKLVLKWYEPTEYQITPSVRHDSDLKENAITITGVQVVYDDTAYLAGDDAYAVNIEGNSLIQHDFDAVASTLHSKLKDFSYTPFSASIKPMPHLYPLDGITFVDKHGVSHATIITDYTFTLNKATAIEGKGETATKNGYAAMNPLTKRERIVLNQILPEINKTLDNRQQAALELNETIANSLGLHRTEMSLPDNSTTYYYHNGATLDDSSVIYTFREGGFAWTDKWEGDDTVWQYGVTKDGNAVLNLLSVYKLTADHIQAGSITSELLSSVYKDAVTNEIKTAIRQTADTITTEVNKKVNDADFGTKITQNYKSVQMAWNSISKYIEFADAAMNIYDSESQGANNLLMKMDHEGAWYYNKGTKIGKIGTEQSASNANYKGLVFRLETPSAYMAWQAQNSDGSYRNVMAFYGDDTIHKKGFYVYGGLYLNSATLYLSDNAYFAGSYDSDDSDDSDDSHDSHGGSLMTALTLFAPETDLHFWGKSIHLTTRDGSNCVLSLGGTQYTFAHCKSSLVDCPNNIDLGAYSILNTSDARFKTNISPADVNALSLLRGVELKSFDWIDSGDHEDIGTIAQQLQQVLPEAVHENPSTGRLSVQLAKFVPYLIKAVQELYALIDPSALENKPSWEDTISMEEKQAFIDACRKKEEENVNG